MRLCFSSVMSVAISLQMFCCYSHGAALNPGDFASLAASLDPIADVTVDTTTLEMSGGATHSGVVSNGIAVFCFDAVNIPAGVVVTVTGSRPFALLSKSTATIAGIINADGNGISGGPGGGSGSTGEATAGEGPGAGGGTSDGGAGGGFGGRGQNSAYGEPGALGGEPYGDLRVLLQGGSGGGRSGYLFPQTGFGGGGGGAVEIGALGAVEVTGAVTARGANGGVGESDGGGAGSGGAILIHGRSGSVMNLNANGGVGGDGGDDGGSGGGGRILVSSTLANGGSVTANGGVSLFNNKPAAQNGTVDFENFPIVNVSAGGPYTIVEGSSLTVTATAFDPDNEALTFSWDLNGDSVFDDFTSQSGSLTWSQLKTLSIVDGPNTYDIAVKVSDGTTTVTSAATILTIDNAAPAVAISGAATYVPGVPYTLTLGDVSDDGDDTVSTFIVNWGDGNSDTYATAGEKTHTYSGSGNFTITIDLTDEDGTFTNAGVPAPFSIAANSPPVSQDDSFAAVTNKTRMVAAPGVMANDSDVDSQSMIAVLETGPSNAASFELLEDGSFTYRSNAGFTGTDSFTYRANDGTLNGNVATVTISVSPNSAPVASNKTITINEDGVFDDSSNKLIATDANGDPLTFSLVTGSVDGNAVVNADGSFSFTPNLNFYGQATFTFKATDDTQADSSVATVTVNVNEVNDAPAAANDARNATEDTQLNMSAADLIANDSAGPSNEIGQALTIVSVAAKSSQGGIVVLNAGVITYTPPENFNGSDTFIYTVQDNGTTSGADDFKSTDASVTLSVAAVNDLPVAANAALTIDENASGSGTLSATDIENSSLTFSLVTGASKGAVVLQENGNYTYTPGPNVNGVDSFIFKANDGSGDSEPATVTITINSINSVPEIVSQPSAVPNPATVLQIVRFNVTANDADGDTLVYTWNFGDQSTGSGNSPVHKYRAAGAYNLNLIISDGNGGSVSHSFVVDVNALSGLLDTDSDGITDSEDSDDDNDGFTDFAEGSAGTDALDPNSMPGGSSDFDVDGITDDLDSDDDNDSFSDSAEISAGTNPYNAISNVGPTGDIDADGIVNSEDKDDDGDGFSDDIEIALGWSPTNSNSTVFNAGAALPPQTLSISKLAIKLNFAKPGSDAITLSGLLPVPENFAASGQQVTVDIGSVIKTFVLDSKGSSPKGDDLFRIKVKAKKGVVSAQAAKFDVKLSKGSFVSKLADEGLVDTNFVKNFRVVVPVTILFNQTQFSKEQQQLYAATPGKSGKTK